MSTDCVFLFPSELKDNLGNDEPEGDMPVLLQTLLSRNPKIFRDKSRSKHTATVRVAKVRHVEFIWAPRGAPYPAETGWSNVCKIMQNTFNNFLIQMKSRHIAQTVCQSILLVCNTSSIKIYQKGFWLTGKLYSVSNRMSLFFSHVPSGGDWPHSGNFWSGPNRLIISLNSCCMIPALKAQLCLFLVSLLICELP